MIVKLPNESVDLSLELLERQSPSACRFFQQQLAKHAWSEASFQTITDESVILGDAKPISLKSAKSRLARFDKPGSVAFSKNSDRQLVIHRACGHIEVGPLIGKLTDKDYSKLEAYLSANTAKRRKVAGPSGSRRSEQLEALLSFEKRLKQIRQQQQQQQQQP